MALKIERYLEEHIEAVIEFNRRLKSGDVRFQFPESSTPHWLPKTGGDSLYREMFLALDERDVVRGGYVLKHQRFLSNDQVTSIGNYGLPLSEGTVDRAFNSVGLLLLMNALRKQPRMYALGMGGMTRPLPRLLAGMGWKLCLVPFYFRVVHAGRFLRNIVYLRTSVVRRLALNIAAFTGLGRLAVRFKQGELPIVNAGVSYEQVDDFDDWADRLWQECRDQFALAAERDSATLNLLYPKSDDRFIRLKASTGDGIVGWVVCMDSQLENHKQFGNMRLGSIVDCLALSGCEESVMTAAAHVLEQRGVDLIVSNQRHEAYGAALTSSGFLIGPSNFALAVSPVLATEFGDYEKQMTRFHFTRGDGDGPINL